MYKFANIRFAEPPVGELRFAAPVPPAKQGDHVENGSSAVVCPQATPYWQWISQQFTEYVRAGNASEFNFTTAQEQLEEWLASSPPELDTNPATTEDCLFLDVVVPQSLFEGANDAHHEQHQWTDQRLGAAVVIWYESVAA